MPILHSMGIKTTLLCSGGLLLAAAGPLGYFSASDVVSAVRKTWLSDSTDQAADTAGEYVADAGPPPTDAATNLPEAQYPIGHYRAATPSLAEALHFDVTVPWITQHWPRVSTGLPHLQLQGYRVALVTGTELTDVAGSLTYYFDARQQVQRITLRGATGDPRVLIGLLADRFHFVRRLTNDPGIALYEAVDSNDRPSGKLKIRSAGVIESSKPYTRYEVDLVVDRAE